MAGWEDAPIEQPAATPAAWESAPIIHAAEGPRVGHGIGDAATAGYQGSIAGLADRGRLPDVVLDPQHAPWYEKLVAGGSQLFHEAPEMFAGGIAGAAAGGLAGPLGAAIGGGAGAFAVPTAIRESLIQAYSKGEVTSSGDFLDRASIVLQHTGKDALVGALTGGAGRAAEVVAAPLFGKAVMGGAIGPTAARVGTEAAKLGAEGTTLTVAPAALEGRLPEPEDFLNTAIMLAGLKGAHITAGRLREIYARTGKTPMEVAADARIEPTLMEDLTKEPPTREMGAGAEVPPEVQFTPATIEDLNGKPVEGVTTEFDNGTGGKGVAEFAIQDGRMFPSWVDNGLPWESGQSTGGTVRKVYEAAIAEAEKRGLAFTSDSSVTTGAVRVYESLARRGYEVEKNPNAHLVEPPEALTARWVTDDKSPVYTVKPKRAPADPLAEYGPELPRAYQGLAREVNTRDAVPEPSPEAARAFVDKPFAEVPQLPGEPVLPTHVNYNYLNTPDDVKGALSRLSQLYTQRITEQTRGTVSWEETYQQARTIYEQTTGEKLPAAPDGANYRNLAADLYAQKQLLISGVEQLMTLRNEYAAARAEGRSTPQQQLELLAQVERVATAQATTRGAQAEVGRALNILKSTNRDKGYYDALNKVIDGRFAIEGKLGDRNFDRMVDLMGDLGSPAEALAFAGRASRATTWDKIVEAWKAGLVSGPITQMANIMGNATFMATRPFVDLAAAAIGLARSSPDRVTAVEPLARVVGNIQGVFDAAKVAASVLRAGGNEAKLETPHREAIGGIAGDVVRVPFRLLSAADSFFRVLNERGEAYSLAVREAAGEGFNPATHEFRTRVLELATNPTQAMQDAIDAAGTRFTFNTPLGPAGQSIQAAIRKTHSEWMVPFVQTPANVAKEMLRLTPLAPFVGEWREAIAAGGAARDQAIAEMAAGTAASVAVFSLALSGHISGAGDPDPKKRAVAMAGGWQPYSVKVGDTWYSYGRLQPVGTVVGMAADMANAWQHFTPEESDKVPKILATAFANAITNQTFLQGITQVINAISDPDRNGARFVQGMAASVVPAVIGQTAQMMDPYQREIDSVSDAVKARIPGLNTELFPKRDPFGEPVPAKDRMGAITPITSATESDDKVRQEAKRLEIGVAKAPDHIELPAGHDKKLGKVALTPEQQDIFATEAGHLAYHVLNQLVHQPTWDNMPDMAQTNAMNLVFEHARKAGRAAAVGPEQMARESDRIANELRNRMAQGK